MAESAVPGTLLAYECSGSGTPVVLLHGLTFDRRMWRPIVERLGGGVQSILVDLPAHGDSLGSPAELEQVATEIHELLESVAIERPIVVGHSMSAGIAFAYASAYPTRGVVAVDQSMYVQPFCELVHRLEPLLRGPGFAQAWSAFEDSLGLDKIPEPQRSLVVQTHRVDQHVVVGYWEQLMRSHPSELQASIDAQLASFDTPFLAVFGRPVTEPELQRLQQVPDCEIEEWLGGGHCVHLVDPGRFAARLQAFVERTAEDAAAAAIRPGVDGPETAAPGDGIVWASVGTPRSALREPSGMARGM